MKKLSGEKDRIKFVLISPDYKLYGDPPLGLAALASYLRRECNFLDINIFDQIKEEKMLKILANKKPEVIGISAVSQNYHKALRLAKIIKKISPSSILMIGGVHITTLPESFKNSPFDIGVRGEGETPAKKFFDLFYEERKINIKKLSKIPGFLIRDKDKIIDTGLSEEVSNLDDLPLPARGMLNMSYYKLPRFSSKEIDAKGAILTSRGCPFACRFCASSSFWRRRIRFFSAERVIQELKILYYKYKYDTIEIYDDLFSINKERLRKIVKMLKDSGLMGKVKFLVMARANSFDEETATLFEQMGVSSLAFGFETGSQKVLNYLKADNVSIENGINAIKIARRHRLPIYGFFMAGAPTEAVEDMEMTYNFIKDNRLESGQILQVTAYPGTECWTYAIKNGIIKKDFYDKKRKDFSDINPDLLLSREISKKDFIYHFYRIKRLITPNKKKIESILFRVSSLRARHLKLVLSREFLEKANSLKKNFIRDVIIR